MLVLVLSLLLLYNVGSSRLRLLKVQFLTYITLIKRSLLQETGFQKSLSRSRCTSETGGFFNPLLILSIGSGSLGDGFGPIFQTTLKWSGLAELYEVIGYQVINQFSRAQG